MERNVMGELSMRGAAGTKPNFSDIARRHGLDRHTVARHWREGEEPEDRRSDRESAFARVREVVEAKAVLPGMTRKGVREMLPHLRNDPPPPGYGAFAAWCRRQGTVFGAPSPEAHPRFETPPGRQLQFDRKEDVRLADSEGEALELNAWTGTLGYSRRHRLVPTRSRTTDDLLSCLPDAFAAFGGIPEEALADNTSALVAFSGGRRGRVERAWRFAEEAGFGLAPCRPGSPETKGKDEGASRFLSRLRAHEGEFTGWEGLLECAARIERRGNEGPNETTGLPPSALFMREKEALRPIGSMRPLQGVVGDVSAQTAPATMLVRAAGRPWSVPRRRTGGRVTVVAMPGGQARARMGGEGAAAHDAAAAAGPTVYDEGRCAEAPDGRRWADGDMRAAARANLDPPDALGGGGGERAPWRRRAPRSGRGTASPRPAPTRWRRRCRTTRAWCPRASATSARPSRR